MDLMIKTHATKLIVKILKASTIIGACFFCAYGFFIVIEANFYHKNVLSCKSYEFVIQACLNMVIVLIFLFSACTTSKMIKA